MLVSFVVALRPLRPGRLGRNVARSLHGVLFALVRSVDPELATRLHEGQGVRPFTVSTLVRVTEGGDHRGEVSPDAVYWVRYTLMADELLAALHRALAAREAARAPVTIDGHPFEILDILTTPEATDGWAQTTTCRQLLNDAGAETRLALHFVSPTTFRTGDVNLLFPLPDSVFASHLRKWETFSPEPLHPDLLSFIRTHVVAERHELETRVVPYAAGAQWNGFVGFCQYRVLGGDADQIRHLNALTDFALFCGTGQKTTQGMGQTRRVAVVR